MVWSRTEERGWVYWENDAEDGTARKEETEKPKTRFMDVVKDDMARAEVTEEEA